MQKRTLVADPCGLIQVIRVFWDKAERGGQGARRRNGVPQRFTVPTAELVSAGGELCVSVSQWGCKNDFAEPMSIDHKRVAVTGGFRYGCVSVSAHPEGLAVRVQYDMENGGAPDRSMLNWPSATGELGGRLIVVAPGQWIRVCYNGRFTNRSTGDWWYEQTTVNAAWFDGAPNGRVFLDRQPVRELSALADLR